MSNQHLQTDARRRRRTAAAAAVLGLGLATGGVATASTRHDGTDRRHRGGRRDRTTSGRRTPTCLAGAEGEVNLVSWAGYVEDGSTDPAVDWVTPFEEITGCAVNNQLGGSSDEMVASDAER